MKMKRLKLARSRRKFVTVSHRDGFMICVGVALALLALVAGRAMRSAQPTPVAASGGITIPWVPDTVKQWQQPIT